MAYTGSIELISGIKTANGGEFPLVDAPDVRIDDSTRLSDFVAAKGSANGFASLDQNGKVPSSQLPSYVDDVLEYVNTSLFPQTGETGKIYVDSSTNKTYRWSGTQYVVIASDLSLGETSGTAYRGDRGKTAYDHAAAKGNAFSSNLYKITTNAQGHVTAATAITKQDLLNYGIASEEDIEDAILETEGHYPYINETNGHWMVWDPETQEFADSGKPSHGADGYNGVGLAYSPSLLKLTIQFI